ncbi:MAG: hypothetical protein JWQ04_2822 [Pedosphaera sp.]|nr:hypothetical protein [Pedosphaera sp.]
MRIAFVLKIKGKARKIVTAIITDHQAHWNRREYQEATPYALMKHNYFPGHFQLRISGMSSPCWVM